MGVKKVSGLGLSLHGLTRSENTIDELSIFFYKVKTMEEKVTQHWKTVVFSLINLLET